MCPPLWRTLRVLRLSHNPRLRWTSYELGEAREQGQQQQQQQQQSVEPDLGPEFWKLMPGCLARLVCLDLRHIGGCVRARVCMCLSA